MNSLSIRKPLASIFAVVLVSGCAFAAGFASEDAGRRVRVELDSKLMGRSMPYEVLRPPGYDSGRKKYPVIYLLHGLTGTYTDWIAKSALSSHSEQHEFILVMPEGGNGWYTDSPVSAAHRYESHLIEEVIPHVEGKFRVRRDRLGRAVAGLSMGGYGAIKFGLKYPGRFAVVGSFSGALRAAEWDMNTAPALRVLGESVSLAFGPKGSETRRDNDIFKLLAKKSADEIKSLPFIYLDCGTEDVLVVQNRDFSGLLVEKKAAHEFRQLPGGHVWPYWDRQVREFLEIAGSRLKAEAAAPAKAAGAK